jgi:hypothetical protein
MPFNNRPEYDSIAEKLDAEKSLHRGYGWKDFDLWQHPDVHVPVTVQARLMRVAPNTIYSWLSKREAYLKGLK